MNISDLLILVDSRLPAGGHSHSGGIAPAIESGLITTVEDLHSALYTRLKYHGPLQASAVHLASKNLDLHTLDRALDIRMISQAGRIASKAQGRGLLRVARQIWPHLLLSPNEHHHPVAFGVIARDLGCSAEAPISFLQQSLMSGASAGVRLLGFDPVEITAVVASLRDEVILQANNAQKINKIEDMPSLSMPGLDVLQENYMKAEVRLFAS